jgi:hypothetical protein
MKVWAVAVVVFFGVAELYQWLQNLTLPLPIYGVAGLLLALVSNAEHWYQPRSKRLSKLDADSVSPADATELPDQTSLPVSPISSQPAVPSNSVQLPNFNSTAQPSISFTIQKRKQ